MACGLCRCVTVSVACGLEELVPCQVTEFRLDQHHLSHHIHLDTGRQEEETKSTMTSLTCCLLCVARTLLLQSPFFAYCLTSSSSFAFLIALILLPITMKVLGEDGLTLV